MVKFGKGGTKEMKIDRVKKKELEGYESIIENLMLLKEEASETNHGEAQAMEAIRANLSALRDSLLESS
jgi:hypothetical protein